MRRKFKLFPILVVLTCGALWAAGLPGESSPKAVPANGAVKALVASKGTNSQNPSKTAFAPTRISGVSIHQANGGQETIVQVASDGSLSYGTFELSNPPRLVIDFKGARNDSGQWKVSSTSPFLKDVRLGRFSRKDGGIIRIVADLTGHPAFEVHPSPKGIRIELQSREMAASQIKPAPSGTSSGSIETEIVTGSRTVPPVAARRTSAATASAARQTTANLAMGKVSAEYRSALPEAGGSAVPVASVRVQSPARLNPETSESAAAEKIIQSEGSSAAASGLPGQGGATGSASKPKYTGEPISLNLKNVDLKDFFRLIHEISGLNILVDPDVNGTVTMVLDSVPWDQALAIVLRDNGLGEELQGNVLRIAKLSTLQNEQKQKAELAAAKIDNEPLVTVFRPVNYAKASTIATMLKAWAGGKTGGGALSSRGTVLVDERTNTLIISDVAERIPVIENIVSKLDMKSAQVSIEARIVRVTSDFARDLQSALTLATINSSGHLTNNVATGAGVGATTASTTSASGGSAITAPVTAASAGGFGVYLLTNAAKRYAINAALAAAETRDEAKTISRPSVVTQDNVQATVIQGTQIPIQTTINNTISVQYVQASLQLQVTPQVTHDGNVFLSIKITNDSPGAVLAIGATAPSINTQSATTSVLVPDGGTVVFGGVTVTQRSKSVTEVPLLGSIPIVGHLFKNTSTTSNDQELLFFVTPKIMKS